MSPDRPGDGTRNSAKGWHPGVIGQSLRKVDVLYRRLTPLERKSRAANGPFGLKELSRILTCARMARDVPMAVMETLVVALIAGAMGLGVIGGMAYTVAKVLFFIFLVLFVVSLLGGAVRRPVP